MKINKLVTTALSFTLIAGAITGCNATSTPVAPDQQDSAGASGTKAGTSGVNSSSDEKISVVCTSFPQYDWVRQLTKGLDDSFDITYLQSTGVDLHSYQASAEDIMKIGSSDMFIYVGGESDSWVDGALKNAINPDLVSINMLEALGDSVKEEELKEGMQDEDHDHEADGEDHDDDEEVEYDEHVWLSLHNAKDFTEIIAAELETLAPEQADSIASNCTAYVAELDKLDSEYEATVASSPVKTIIFGDRFPFRYLADDYGLDYYAAFVGCSAETEASFETISFLANKVDELQVPAILTIENSDQKVAKTILNNTKTKNQEILVVDSIQSVSQEAIDSGKTYISTMQDNLEVLKKALDA